MKWADRTIIGILEQIRDSGGGGGGGAPSGPAGGALTGTYPNPGVSYASSTFPDVDLATVTVATTSTLVRGQSYYGSINSATWTIVFNGSAGNGGPPTVLRGVQFVQQTTLTIPSSYRQGATVNPITSIVIDAGYHTLSWVHSNGVDDLYDDQDNFTGLLLSVNNLNDVADIPTSRSNLGVAASGVNADITQLTTSLTAPLSVNLGATSSPTAFAVGDTSSTSPRGLMSWQSSTDALAAHLHMRKTRGTFATPTTVAANDILGRVVYSAYDGASYLEMATIRATAVGTVASTRVPTKLEFLTATDAAPSVATVALTLNKDQTAAFASTVSGSDPTSSAHFATKNYVDTAFAGLSPRTSCRMATTANITGTYVQIGSGPGSTLTYTATGAQTVDGVTPALNDRILIKDQTTGAQNGIYTWTTLGATAISAVLTRASDYDQTSEVFEGTFTEVVEGTANATTQWTMNTSGSITIGTTTITWAKLVGSSSGDASTNTSSSIDGEGAYFSGTAGKTIKRAITQTLANDAVDTIGAGTASVKTSSTALTAERAITLPAANTYAPGQGFWFYDNGGILGATNTVGTQSAIATVNYGYDFTRAGSDTINGLTTAYGFYTNYGKMFFQSDGVSNWTTMQSGGRAYLKATGSSSSGTATTQVAEIDASANTHLVEFFLQSRQASATSLTHKLIVTYADNTTDSFTTTNATTSGFTMTPAGVIDGTAATLVATALQNKNVIKIRVETAGTSSSGGRTALISAVQVPQ